MQRHQRILNLQPSGYLDLLSHPWTIYLLSMPTFLGCPRCPSIDSSPIDSPNLHQRFQRSKPWQMPNSTPLSTQEPATCCCPPRLPWKRQPTPISTGCAGSAKAVNWQTNNRNWKSIFANSRERCQTMQQKYLSDMLPTNQEESHECLPSFALKEDETTDNSNNKNYYYRSPVMQKLTVKQYMFDHVLVGVPLGWRLDRKKYSLIDVNFAASDHLPLLSRFSVTKLAVRPLERRRQGLWSQMDRRAKKQAPPVMNRNARKRQVMNRNARKSP